MTHLHKQTHISPTQRAGRRPLRKLLLLPLTATALAFAGTSCSAAASLEPRPIVTDTTPVGNGLKVIGYALLGSAVVMVLGSMIKN
jgi:hypothetical protein